MGAFENPEAMKVVLTRMAELMQIDEAIGAASKAITIDFEFPDMEIAFYTKFLDGRIEADFGVLEDADINLTMDSDTFDGVFTGSVNVPVAIMRGDLGFAGDTSAAMRLLGLLKDFQRLYVQAKG